MFYLTLIRDDFDYFSPSNVNCLAFIIKYGLEYSRNYSIFVSVLDGCSFDDAATMSDCVTWNDEMSSE